MHKTNTKAKINTKTNTKINTKTNTSHLKDKWIAASSTLDHGVHVPGCPLARVVVRAHLGFAILVDSHLTVLVDWRNLLIWICGFVGFRNIRGLDIAIVSDIVNITTA